MQARGTFFFLNRLKIEDMLAEANVEVCEKQKREGVKPEKKFAVRCE